MFKDKILECRKKAGLSQEELAHQLGVSRQSVSKWENGSSFPEMDKCIELCKLFHISLDELFLDESTKTIDENFMNNVSHVIQKNNHHIRLISGISLAFVALMTLICFISLSYMNSQLQGAQNNLEGLNRNYAELYHELRDLKLQINQPNSNLDTNIDLNFKSIQYLNNKEVSIHLETRLPEEIVDNKVQIVFEFDSGIYSFDLMKNTVLYEADVLLPVEHINKATVVVQKGDILTNHLCYINTDIELKKSLDSMIRIDRIRKENESLILETKNIGSDATPSIKKIQAVEFVDKKGQIIKKTLISDSFSQYKVNYDLKKEISTWDVYFVYEKDDLQIRQFMGSMSHKLDGFLYVLAFDSISESISDTNEIQIIE